MISKCRRQNVNMLNPPHKQILSSELRELNGFLNPETAHCHVATMNQIKGMIFFTDHQGCTFHENARFFHLFHFLPLIFFGWFAFLTLLTILSKLCAFSCWFPFLTKSGVFQISWRSLIFSLLYHIWLIKTRYFSLLCFISFLVCLILFFSPGL